MSADPVKTIAESPYFNADWYRRTYPDVALSGMDPVQHYLHVGAPMGRDPGPEFSASFYMERHADVRVAGHNPLWHYALFGQEEAREIAPSRVHRNGIDEEIAASEIDRHCPALPVQEAEERLREIFAATLTRRPHRFMTEFDMAPARAVVEALSSLPEAELAARRIRASIVMPSYNRADKIGAAIGSVLRQSHHDFELIVVDDGSTDGTAAVLDGVGDDPRLRVIEAAHGGVSAARNLGLEAAEGEVIFYLDSDNRWTRDYLRLMLIALTVSGAQSAYAALRVQDGAGNVSGYRGEPFSRSFCLKGNYVDLNVFCHRRTLYEEKGGFDPALKRMVDWDLVLRYTAAERPIFCPFIGCLYTDDRADPLRVSTAQPYLFAQIVQLKNAQGHASIKETIAHLTFRIALKIGTGEAGAQQAQPLAAALRTLGHEVRIDPPSHWTARHAHQDDIVVIFDDPAAYTPHPEQISMIWGPSPEISPYLCCVGHAPPPAEAKQDAYDGWYIEQARAICDRARGVLMSG